MTQDWYNKSYAAPQDDSAVTCDRHTAHGGGWLFGPRYLRAAFRGKNTAEEHIFGDGFRIASTL
jgi:formylglycine-generating enzyme required for sulfatase activity